MHMNIKHNSYCHVTTLFFALRCFCEIQTWLVCCGNFCYSDDPELFTFMFSEHYFVWLLWEWLSGRTITNDPRCFASLPFPSFLHRQPVKYLLSTKRRRKQWLGDNEYEIIATHLKPWITQIFTSEVWILCVCGGGPLSRKWNVKYRTLLQYSNK